MFRKSLHTHSHSSKEPSPAPHSNDKSLSAEEQQLLRIMQSYLAKLFSILNGRVNQLKLLPRLKTTRNSPDSISIPNSGANHGNENQNVTISTSYQNTKNGIVESVITVKGVPKTIIGPAKRLGRIQKSEYGNENINQENSNRSDDRESSSSNASLFSSIKNKFKNENANNNDRSNFTDSLSRTSNYDANGSSSTIKR
nr:BFH_HP1_G0048900.mRNA.1.CDS.1 [Saccharomyces cerevisiae]